MRFLSRQSSPSRAAAYRIHLRLGALQQLEFLLESGVFIFLRSFFQPLQPLFDLSQIAHQQIELDILNVFSGSISPACGTDGSSTPAPREPVRPRCADARVSAVFQRFLADRANVYIFDRGVRKLSSVVKRG